MNMLVFIFNKASAGSFLGEVVDESTRHFLVFGKEGRGCNLTLLPFVLTMVFRRILSPKILS